MTQHYCDMQADPPRDVCTSMLHTLSSAHVCIACAGSHATAQEPFISSRSSDNQCSSSFGVLYGATTTEPSTQSSAGPFTEQSPSDAMSRTSSPERQHADRDYDRLQHSSRLASHGPVSQLSEVHPTIGPCCATRATLLSLRLSS